MIEYKLSETVKILVPIAEPVNNLFTYVNEQTKGVKQCKQ